MRVMSGVAPLMMPASADEMWVSLMANMVQGIVLTRAP